MKNDDLQFQESDLGIAIIGFAGRFPGAKNAEQYWENLRAGVESISFFSDEELIAAGVERAILDDPNYVKAAPILEDADKFDAQLFAYSPREARMMDPQHRLLLECAWEALEHAGYDAGKYQGSVGVYAGSAMNTYLLFSGLLPHFNKEYLLTLINNDKDFLATRLSYKLNLTGPSVTVQTACSTSLVAVHIACQSLLNEECDIALAGGVSIRVPLKAGYFHQDGSVFSPDGHCRTFDAEARGTIFGSGVGIVVLKRLADALADGDCIHAVIRGSAINNDGSSKVEFTAPSVISQSEAVVEALANAGVSAATLSYVEAHGTGTQLGDPIEISALTRAFRAFTDKQNFCAIGSTKPNIGHMDAAAGAAGLIKTVQALKHKTIPPLLHYQKPNAEIDFADSPFYVNATLAEWKAGASPRRAGINSLGMGGTNAFVVLEEAPDPVVSGDSRPYQLLLLSAKTAPALQAMTKHMADYMARHTEAKLADAAYTLQVGRKDLEHRAMLVCTDSADAATALSAPDSKRIRTSFQKPVTRDIAFILSGQGTQYVNMGFELYQTEREFRERVDLCCEILQPDLSCDVREILFPQEQDIAQASQKLDQTYLTQPALFIIEYALAGLWMSWGATPAALLGHSIGEYVAACLAGVFSLPDALRLVASRGQLMQELPGGSMLAVPLSEETLRPQLTPALSLAAVNSPTLCIVAGETPEIENLSRRLAEQKLSCRLLRTSHAFHSAMMEPILETFAAEVRKAGPQPPQLPFISNVTGTWIKPDEATDPAYWSQHIRRTVRFADGLHVLLQEPHRIFLEIGPGETFSSLTKIHPDKTADQIVLSSLRSPKVQQSDIAYLLNSLGQLWLSGFEPRWTGFYGNERRRRLPLPTYPFQRQRFWIDAAPAPAQRPATPSDDGALTPPGPLAVDEPVGDLRERAPGAAYVGPRTLIEEKVADIWQQILGIPQVGIHDDFFELGGNSILVMQAVNGLNETFHLDLSALNVLESATVAGMANCIETIYRLGNETPFPPPEANAVQAETR